MDSIQKIANKNPRCGATVADTGTLGCQVEFGTPVNAIALKKGFIIPKATIFDKTYIDTQIQIGNFIPLIDADSFEEMSSEDTMNTNTKGVDRLSVLGLPKYKLTFQSGHEFYRQIAKLTSFKSLDVIFGDESGNWRLAVTSSGDFKGFSCGQILAMMTKTKVSGGEPESKSITMQMLDRNEWDMNYAIIEASSLSFSTGDIAGINGVEISTGPLAAAATTIVATIVLAADRHTPVQGWLVANFLVTADGVKVTPTTVAETSPGVYTITVPALVAGKKMVVSSYDNTAKTTAILLDGVLFRGVSEPVTVA